MTFIATLALAASAEASTLSATYEFSSRPDVHESVAFTYTAAAGERNDLAINETNAGALVATFSDRGALISGPSPVVFGTQLVASTCVPALLIVSCVSIIDSTSVTANLGDGNDRARADGSTSALFNGGPGNDATGGGSASEYSYAGPGADAILGGGGDDTADYRAHTGPLNVTLDGVANDGLAGEGDNVGPDVEGVWVGGGPSTVVGSASRQFIWGVNGVDHFVAGGGDDTLWGGGGNDTLEPGPGSDTVAGEASDDTVVLQVDGAADQIGCGSGMDTVIRVGGVDPLDTIASDCEVIS